MASTRSKLLAFVAASGLILTGCSTSDEGHSTKDSASVQKISVEDNFGTQEVPQNPKAVASTDNRTFEVLDEWGVDLVAAPKRLIPKTIPDYKNNDDIADMGSHREPNLEALVATQPDLIINGQRFDSQYDEIKKLNPNTAIVDFEPRDDKPMDQELKRQVTELGKIFDKEKEAQKLIDDFDAALKRAKDAYDGKSTVMAVNVSGGEIGYVAPKVGRFFGPMFEWIGMKPALEVKDATDDHKGDDISVEAIADSNPDWMLVLDRDAAIQAGEEEGYTPAVDVIKKNQALAKVTAVKDDNVVLAPADTYTNESIITYTKVLNQIADAMEKHKG
ncbi:siderophore ABC transporter substrate-binding protein [Corynebacterium anserum]|uniref:ABC transporter substrate-binding protein n=1 Tax=Corynebacterium anserum TaxID=2684406 RepID=A0A7G7YQ62_9CORY|nr:ABC transporter substrate-binding protein [Corynebacterium anserum]QNH96632.1 ABC transporter substrate-binding protein [Corynebacterium anserum]